MNKKIIFIGPPGSGKTTLRKIFFEGENSSNILEYSLEPTRGQDSILLNLSEDIGVFDLGGQENQRWFETEENTIFFDTKIILIVVDISTSIEKIINFTRKVIEIREELTPLSNIFVLMHKIDLVNQEKIIDISKIIYNTIKDVRLIKIYFTSVTKDFIAQTFIYFIEILKACIIDAIEIEKSSLYLLEEILKLLYIVYKKEFISKRDIQIKLNRSEKIINLVFNHLIENGFIQFSGVHEQEKLFFLTHKGKKHFDEFLENFTLETLIKREKVETLELSYLEKNIPPFIGVFIANQNGENLLNIEIHDGMINNVLNLNFIQKKSGELSDDEIILSFNKALEKFIQQSDIISLSGLKLRECKINFFSHGKFIVVFLSKQEINFKNFKSTIRDYFKKLYEQNKIEFDILGTGSSIYNKQLIQIGKKWLIKLNKSYEEMLVDLEIFDFIYAKTLFYKLEELSNKISPESYDVHEKIKKLKIKLMSNALEEDLKKLKKVAKDVHDISLKFSI